MNANELYQLVDERRKEQELRLFGGSVESWSLKPQSTTSSTCGVFGGKGFEDVESLPDEDVQYSIDELWPDCPESNQPTLDDEHSLPAFVKPNYPNHQTFSKQIADILRAPAPLNQGARAVPASHREIAESTVGGSPSVGALKYSSLNPAPSSHGVRAIPIGRRAFAESTICGSSSMGTLKHSSLNPASTKRLSTAATSFLPPSVKKPRLTQETIPTTPEITEPLRDSERKTAVDPIRDDCSILSSVVALTTPQRYQIINGFTDALLKKLRGKYPLWSDNPSSIPLHQRCHDLLKEYAEKAKEGTDERPKRQASKAIRALRHEISKKFEELFLGSEDPEQNRVQPSIIEKANKLCPPEISFAQIISNWSKCVEDIVAPPSANSTKETHQLPRPPDVWASLERGEVDLNHLPDSISGSSSRDTSSLRGSSEGDFIPVVENREIFDYLTSHEAFTTLVKKFQRIVEHHYINVMEFVRQRILLAIRRPGNPTLISDHSLQVVFQFDLDIPSFLQEQYDDGLRQDIGHILTVTGRAKNAQLLTVVEYLIQTWKESDLQSNRVVVDLSERIVTVIGPEDLVVTVGQQLSWICAACRGSRGTLSYGHVLFHEVDISSDPSAIPIFKINTEIVGVDTNESRSCWCAFLPGSVIAAGFPIRPRLSNEAGLEIPLEIMSALGGILNATEFGGGYILKGRSTMFVPIERLGDSVQWHFLKKNQGRISYKDVRTLCPTRLMLAEFGEKALHSTRAFLGWYSATINHLATESFDYTALLPPSKITPLSKNVLKLTGGSVGFTKIATASAQFSIGRKDGTYHAQHSEFYEDLLDDARQTHVILQDMTQRRAWHTDGQRFILHAILNRHSLKPYRVDYKLVKFDSAVCDQPDSVFDSMVQNRDLILRRDQHLDKEDVQVKLFRDEVRELYQMLEGLQAETENVSEAGIELKLSWEQQVQGWNYMEFLQRKPRMKVHETGLKKTCGQWPAFARDNGAVVFFADNFNDVIQPATSASLCNKFKNVPRDKDYLTIQTSILCELLHENHSLPGQALVTARGLQWHSSAHLFEPCPKSGIRPTRQVSCRCDRIQQFSSRRRNAKIELPNPLPKYGAAIFGRGSAHTASESGQLQSPSKYPVSAGRPGMQDSSVPVLETSYIGTDVEASSYPEHLDPVGLAPSPSDAYACTALCHDVDMADAGYNISPPARQGYFQESQIETDVSGLFTRRTSQSSRTNTTGFTDERFNPFSSESSYSNHADRNQGRMAMDSSYNHPGDLPNHNEDFVFQPNGLKNDYINPNSHPPGRVTFNQAWNPAVTEAMISSGPQIQHQEFLQMPATRQAFNSFGGKYEALNQNPSPAETLADASSKKTLRRKRPFLRIPS